ncbi:hypothetical protein AVEN_216082-1 [Araneus ventricosus]|uniref:Uncharacterized protein n=1 Tax=Araneus ventricosus TaxID=182803 RepID=A0A4Y2IWG7_ARAVE|nr:hypothetical protein AVEN_216082-1 [Araneus ventricosus]
MEKHPWIAHAMGDCEETAPHHGIRCSFNVQGNHSCISLIFFISMDFADGHRTPLNCGTSFEKSVLIFRYWGNLLGMKFKPSQNKFFENLTKAGKEADWSIGVWVLDLYLVSE